VPSVFWLRRTGGWSCRAPARCPTAPAAGTTRSPTCRAAVRVDLLASQGERGSTRLCYSLASTEAYTDLEQQRLARQARDAQVQRLRVFGDYLRKRQPGDAPSCKPTCPCGAELRCFDVQARLEATGASQIFCDICSKNMTSGTVWSCQRGDGTIIHPFSNDVCGACFEESMGTGEQASEKQQSFLDDFGGALDEEDNVLGAYDERYHADVEDTGSDDGFSDGSIYFKYEDDFGGTPQHRFAEGESRQAGVLSALGLDFGYIT